METRKPTEPEVLATFLATSEDFKQMRLSAMQCQDSVHYEGVGTDYNGMKAVRTRPEQELVDKISKATSFAMLLDIMKQQDFAQHSPDDRLAGYLGHSGMKKIAWVGGFFSDHVNFAYYNLSFLEKTKEIIATHGFQATTAPKPS